MKFLRKLARWAAANPAVPLAAVALFAFRPDAWLWG